MFKIMPLETVLLKIKDKTKHFKLCAESNSQQPNGYTRSYDCWQNAIARIISVDFPLELCITCIYFLNILRGFIKDFKVI